MCSPLRGRQLALGQHGAFPYLVGENGGGAYVLLFCIAMIVIGIPMILVENVIGRRLRVNSIDAFGDKSKIKVKHLQILEDSWLHGGFLAHLVSWLITWY